MSRPSVMPMTERRFRHDPAGMSWVSRARCIGEDPELFFPIGAGDRNAARARELEPAV
jgi:hypothetical protein